MADKAILVIEDDAAILRGLQDNLLFEGYRVLTAADGESGLRAALENDVDLVVLDIMLPGKNGYDICRTLKQTKPELPVVMLTARGQEIDIISGLDLGADDYITKPFSVPQLLARIRAILRRYCKSRELARYAFGDVLLDFGKCEAQAAGQSVHLSAREFAIMKYLIGRAGEVVHRHDLLDEVWGYENFPTTRTVDTYISELRKKLEPDPAHPRHLLSFRSIGYKFVP